MTKGIKLYPFAEQSSPIIRRHPSKSFIIAGCDFEDYTVLFKSLSFLLICVMCIPRLRSMTKSWRCGVSGKLSCTCSFDAHKRICTCQASLKTFRSIGTYPRISVYSTQNAAIYTNISYDMQIYQVRDDGCVGFMYILYVYKPNNSMSTSESSEWYFKLQTKSKWLVPQHFTNPWHKASAEPRDGWHPANYFSTLYYQHGPRTGRKCTNKLNWSPTLALETLESV